MIDEFETERIQELEAGILHAENIILLIENYPESFITLERNKIMEALGKYNEVKHSVNPGNLSMFEFLTILLDEIDDTPTAFCEAQSLEWQKRLVGMQTELDKLNGVE